MGFWSIREENHMEDIEIDMVVSINIFPKEIGCESGS